MNPLNHPEFWLSFSFLLVVGLIVFPPIRRYVQGLFAHQRYRVETDIQNAQNVYREALQARQDILKELKIKPVDKEITLKIKSFQKEYEERIETQIQAKRQDFRVRQNLMELQIKNHLRKELLDKAEEKLTFLNHKNVSEKEIAHFIKVLNENEMLLKKSLE